MAEAAVAFRTIPFNARSLGRSGDNRSSGLFRQAHMRAGHMPSGSKGTAPASALFISDALHSELQELSLATVPQVMMHLLYFWYAS